MGRYALRVNSKESHQPKPPSRQVWLVICLLFFCSKGGLALGSEATVLFKAAPDYSLTDPFRTLSIPECITTKLHGVNNLDLNGDGLLDFLLTYLCGPLKFESELDEPEFPYDHPAPNNLLILLSTGEGDFEISNEDMLGAARVQIGGEKGGLPNIPNSCCVDLNGDGVYDPVFNTNRDDGRFYLADYVPNSSITSQQQYLLSNSEGGFTISNIGDEPIYPSGYLFLPNNSGSFDLLYSRHDETEGPPFIVRFQTATGSFESIVHEYADDQATLDLLGTTYKQFHMNLPAELPDGVFSAVDHFFTVEQNREKPNSPNWAPDQGITLMSYTPGDGFTELTAFYSAEIFEEVRCPETDGFFMANCYIDDLDRLLVANIRWVETKFWLPTPTGNLHMLVRGETWFYPPGESFDYDEVYSREDFEETTVYAHFRLSQSGLERVSVPLTRSDYADSDVTMSIFADYNGDSYTDALGFNQRGSVGNPTLRLNDGTGVLLAADTQWPELSSYFYNVNGHAVEVVDFASWAMDVNADGILDLVKYHVTNPHVPDYYSQFGDDLEPFAYGTGHFELWLGDVDTDGDGLVNGDDLDDDGDGVQDTDDAFPLDASETTDTDSDGIGNNTDNDDDGDGVADTADLCPLANCEPRGVTIISSDSSEGSIELLTGVADDGGEAVQLYRATCTDGVNTFSAESDSPRIIVTGLDSSSEYRCTVTAINARGESAPSASTGTITPETSMEGLPIWLLYEARRSN